MNSATFSTFGAFGSGNAATGAGAGFVATTSGLDGAVAVSGAAFCEIGAETGRACDLTFASRVGADTDLGFAETGLEGTLDFAVGAAAI
ncbi:MAG: hypothetical protein AAF665_19775 [Pseudomonadota bacterium]